MNATEELRRLLDERGVKWYETVNSVNCVFTWWESPLFGEVHAMDNEDDKTLFMACLNNCDFTPEQVIVMTLGSGKLTAEQVREAIFNGSAYASYDGAKYYADGIHMQTIADELNATLGDWECVPHGEWESISQTQEVRHVFCECGYELGMDRRDSFPFKCTKLFAMPNFCPDCGAKIRKVMR